jgi:hypothetical protein
MQSIARAHNRIDRAMADLAAVKLLLTRISGKEAQSVVTPRPNRRQKNGDGARGCTRAFCERATERFTATDVLREYPNFRRGEISVNLAALAKVGDIVRVSRGSYRRAVPARKARKARST